MKIKRIIRLGSKMKAIKIEQNQVTLKTTLSVKKDHYLNSHRFGKTPYFPFVMGMELFCSTCLDRGQSNGQIVFSDFEVQSPLILRHDRDKNIFIESKKSKLDKKKYQVKIRSEDQAVFFTGDILADNKKNFQRARKLKIDKNKTVIPLSNRLYEILLPHGPHFYNNFDIIRSSENGAIIKQYNFQNNLPYYENLGLKDLNLNPALLDGVLQLCSLHSMKYNGYFLLPIKAQKCVIDKKVMADVSETYVVIKKIKDKIFDVFVYDDNYSLIVEFKKLEFAKLSRAVPEYEVPHPVTRNYLNNENSF